MKRTLPLILSPALLFLGCGDGLDIPIPIESPPQEINATEQVEALEDSLCENAESEQCLVLQAIDYSDDDNVSDPPRMPDEFPTTVTLVDPESGVAIPDPDTGEPQEINVLEYLDEVNAADSVSIKQVVPIDLRQQAAQAGITDPSVIENISIGGFAMNWLSNSLTFSTIDLDLYAAPQELATDADVDALIADGTVQKVGTIPAQAPGETGETPISFVAGGNDVLNASLRNLIFSLIVAVPEGTELELADGAAANTKKKPQGIAEVSVKATVVYTIKGPSF